VGDEILFFLVGVSVGVGKEGGRRKVGRGFDTVGSSDCETETEGVYLSHEVELCFCECGSICRVPEMKNSNDGYVYRYLGVRVFDDNSSSSSRGVLSTGPPALQLCKLVSCNFFFSRLGDYNGLGNLLIPRWCPVLRRERFQAALHDRDLTKITNTPLTPSSHN
jgi:hypothetical protein